MSEGQVSRMQEMQAIAERLFPAAVIALGSVQEGRSAVIDAAAAAYKRVPEANEQAVLTQLLRICRERAPEHIEHPDFPQLKADDPLLPVFRLTASGRRSMALYLSDLPEEECIAARGITQEEFIKKREKTLRQLRFLQNGEEPDRALLRSAAGAFQWDDECRAALDRALTAVRAEETPSAEPEPEADNRVRDISHKKNQASTQKTVAVPIWALIAGGLLILLLIAAFWAASLHRKERSAQPALSADSEAEAEVDYESLDELNSRYLSLSEVHEIVRGQLGSDAQAVFLNTKLKLKAEPVCYEITVLDSRGKEYFYKLDAESGGLLSEQEYSASVKLDTKGWLPADEMRKKALEYTGLPNAVYLKEKCGVNEETGYYKYELSDAAGRVYTVQMEAQTGALIKYTVEEPQEAPLTDAITPEEAQQKALSKVGDLSLDQAIFTKVKRDGNVYLIAFTLDDGTQYMLELNAKDGMTNTFDVHPVSADTSKAIGLLKARDIVLDKAGLTGTEGVRFTKAKIDRDNGAYVYELKFETASYEYEVTLNTETGEMLEYRAWKL